MLAPDNHKVIIDTQSLINERGKCTFTMGGWTGGGWEKVRIYFFHGGLSFQLSGHPVYVEFE